MLLPGDGVFLARGADAGVDCFVEVGADELDVVIGFGGFLLELVDGVEEDGGRGGGAQTEDFFRRVRDFLQELAEVAGEDAEAVDIGEEMHEGVVEVFGGGAVGSDEVDFVFPCEYDGVVAAPL